jgi:hypothetical protein
MPEIKNRADVSNCGKRQVLLAVSFLSTGVLER